MFWRRCIATWRVEDIERRSLTPANGVLIETIDPVDIDAPDRVGATPRRGILSEPGVTPLLLYTGLSYD